VVVIGVMMLVAGGYGVATGGPLLGVFVTIMK